MSIRNKTPTTTRGTDSLEPQPLLRWRCTQLLHLTNPQIMDNPLCTQWEAKPLTTPSLSHIEATTTAKTGSNSVVPAFYCFCRGEEKKKGQPYYEKHQSHTSPLTFPPLSSPSSLFLLFDQRTPLCNALEIFIPLPLQPCKNKKKNTSGKTLT